MECLCVCAGSVSFWESHDASLCLNRCVSPFSANCRRRYAIDRRCVITGADFDLRCVYVRVLDTKLGISEGHS